ncbi:hypothetical protein MMC27_006596 [Xylographa pallens]|nr:hypothetical protein [Xylographa pallens]
MNVHHSAAQNVKSTPPNMPDPKGEDDDVNGDGGYVSDDSSFYGDTDLQTHLCNLVDSAPISTILPPVYLQFTTMALANAAATTSSKPTTLYNRYEGEISARQLDEPVSAFLERLPPLTTQLSSIGPWIFIANPYSTARPTSENWAKTNATGADILADFERRRAGVEASMQGRPAQTVTKKLNPLRETARTAILAAARENGCGWGKWMLFPTAADVNRVWGVVARATAAGELGGAAKVATENGQGANEARLICVYTEDFSDKQDVKRVLLKLEELGLAKRKSEWGQEIGVSYKPDVFTYLDITGSNNRWGLKPSLYQSKEALAWAV